MPDRNFIIVTIIVLSSLSPAYGQKKLVSTILPDSLIKELKIRKITESWFADPEDTIPANTTFEIYDESGYRTRRVHINYHYHKFIKEYRYNFKQGSIIETERYYDWNPYREKNKEDTILKKSKEKYDLETKYRNKTNPGGLSSFNIIFSYDSIGRIIQSTDTIKCGYYIIKYSYSNKGKVVEKKHFLTHHSEKPHLSAIDSLFYYEGGKLLKVTNYYFRENPQGLENYKLIEISFNYNDSGLVEEKRIVSQYLSLENSKPIPAIYKYKYEFY